MEMKGSKQHPIVPFTLSTRFNGLVLTLVIYHTTLLSASFQDVKERIAYTYKNKIEVFEFLRIHKCHILFLLTVRFGVCHRITNCDQTNY